MNKISGTASYDDTFIVFVLYNNNLRVTIFKGGFYLPNKQYDKKVDTSKDRKEIIETELLQISGGINNYKITYNF